MNAAASPKPRVVGGGSDRISRNIIAEQILRPREAGEGDVP